MRGVCHLSRRWHQQFCLSPSFAAHRQCLQHFQPIRTFRQLPRTKAIPKSSSSPSQSAFGGLNIREFEQSGQDASTRVRVHDALEAEGYQVEEELKELEKDLAILREGPFGPNSEFMQSFSAEDREELLKALEEEGVNLDADDDLLSPEELNAIARATVTDRPAEQTDGPLKVTLRIPLKDKIYVKRFNLALEEAETVKDNARPYLSLWKWYLKCQQHVSNFHVILPEDVWHFLWKSQSSRINFRAKHLQMLAKDMMRADISLTDREWLQYIDALQAGGDIASAAVAWDSQKARLGLKEELASDFWMTGVNLYVALGRPRKAQTLALECYDRTSKVEPELFVAVISAWAESQSHDAEERAWSCYLEMRKMLESREGKDDTLNILGRISTILLESGHSQLALAVFKDLFLLRANSPTDSWKIFKSMATKSGSTEDPNPDHINRIGLAALAFLPKTFHNKFFFASWIKWLLGEGQVDEAAQVVDLMYERGLRPDARHLNGIIASWLRLGSPSACEKAEMTAWAMIQSRIAMVKSRQALEAPTKTPTKVMPNEVVVQPTKTPTFLRRGAPPATIETFSILLLYYTRRSGLQDADRLSKTMIGPAEMKPNSFIMNHWMYASLRSGDIPEVWKTYSTFRSKIQPDLETFAALWDTAKVHFGSPAAHLDNVPSPRILFKEMMKWQQSLTPQKKEVAEEEITTDFYEQVIRCFCFTSDLEGTLCAIHGMHQTFGMYPHDEASRLVITQVARSFPWVIGPAERARLRRRRGPLRVRGTHLESAVKAVTQIVLAIVEKKAEEQNLDPDLLEDEDEDDSHQAQTLRLDVLTSFLCMVIERKGAPLTNTTLTARGHNIVEVATAASPRAELVKPEGQTRAEGISRAAEEMMTTIPAEVLTRRDWTGLHL